MKEELIKILPDLKQAVEQGFAYAGDLFNRAVIYYKVSMIIWGILSLSVVIAYVIYIYKTNKWVKREDEDNEWDDRIISLLIGGFLTFFAFIMFCFCVDGLIQLYIVPEIYILQLLTN